MEAVVNDKKALGELDLLSALKLMWKFKYLTLLGTLLSAGFSVWIALSIPNKYSSIAKLTLAEQDKTSSLASMAGGLGSLASMAGVNLGGKTDKSFYYSELLKSKAFILPFIEKYELAPALIAANGWDISSKELKFDPEVYDVDNKAWTRKVVYPFTNPPSDWELYEAFRRVVSFEYEKKSSLITVRANFYSPYFTRDVVTNLILEFNEKVRSEDIAEAQKSIAYLEKEIAKNNIVELNQLSYNLITENKKTLMLANIRDEYALKTIEPAIVVERKSGPKRAMICVGITLFGALLFISYPFIRLFTSEFADKLKAS